MCGRQLFELFAVVMNTYHFSLMAQNLTTNEQMNVMRYPYLRDDMGRYNNAFDSGVVGNFADMWRRRDAIAANPYWYTERFTQKQLHGEKVQGGAGGPQEALLAIEEGAAEDEAESV